MTADVTQNVLMYFVLPLWLAAGFADWLCHRASNIATTSGAKESVIHLIMFAEMAIPVTAAIALEINALIIAVMIVCFILHEATALWDVSYATEMREVTPIEQHVHSFLEVLPLMGLVLVAVLNWDQFLALFGLGQGSARFTISLKQPPLPWAYIISILTAVVVLELLPFIEELIRGLRANGGRLVPRHTPKSVQARRADRERTKRF